jgi:hypothetical protein
MQRRLVHYGSADERFAIWELRHLETVKPAYPALVQVTFDADLVMGGVLMSFHKSIFVVESWHEGFKSALRTAKITLSNRTLFQFKEGN